jgi:gas vesicle protein
MSAKNWIEVVASLAGGAGIGMGLMYIFDPERGEVRRRHLAEAADRAWEAAGTTLGATGEALEETWDDVSGRARGWGRQVSKRARQEASHLMDRASDARSSAGDWLDDAADQARGYGRKVANRASRYASRAGAMFPLERHHAGSAFGVTAGVVGALALGAGLMYLFDPNQGRRRREHAREMATHYTHEASQAVRTGAQKATETLRHGAQQAADCARDAAQHVKQEVKQKTGTPSREARGTGTGASAPTAT